MNNKGQTLVIFVIILPIILMLFTLVIDLGFLSIEKRKVDNNTYDALEYYLSNISNEDVESNTYNLLESNLDDIKITINNTNKYIEIEVQKEYKGLFSALYNNIINIKYIGNKENNEIIKG